jgi:peptide/nickel transport system permease protein
MNAETHQQFLARDISLARPVALPFDPRRLLVPLRQSDPALVLSGLVVVVLAAWALAPAWIAPFSPTDMDHGAILQAPSAAHRLGTDHLGRDILSLLIYGARQSLFIGLTATAIGTLLGGLLGLIAGYAGRTVDMALMRLLDIWMSVPDVLLVIILATALTPSTTNMILTIGIVLVPRYARVMRSQVIAIKGQPYVEASRAIGASHAHLLIRHILPQTLSPMLVMVTLGIAGAVLMVAMLSFIGLGVIDDIPDWGYLLSQGRSYLTVAWWFGTFPGLAITALVISVNLLGEALRHRLDPRSQAR